MSDQLKKYEERKAQMIQYLRLKLDEEDWHGVQDAASDLRDIESERLGFVSAHENVTFVAGASGVCESSIYAPGTK